MIVQSMGIPFVELNFRRPIYPAVYLLAKLFHNIESKQHRGVLKAGATATETELRNYARDHLAHFKCPQQIQFVPELPKTATGKVQKYVLRGKPAISKQ